MLIHPISGDEDVYAVRLDLDGIPGSNAYFGICDGHTENYNRELRDDGELESKGKYVAKKTASQLPQSLVAQDEYRTGRIAEALDKAYIQTNSWLQTG